MTILDEDSLRRAQDLLGYGFDQPDLLAAALTHPSLGGAPNYQRLEFLGDRVLGLVISHWLYETYPDEAEGKLNRRFTALVRKETLAHIALALGLAPFIRLEAGAQAEGTHEAPGVLADICEAVIGAIYLDGGLAPAQHFIKTHWSASMKNGPQAYRDAKTALQEWAQGRGLPLPCYQLVGRTGPDHNPKFEIEVSVKEAGTARAHGPSKRQAEQQAATHLLEKLAPERDI
ncbi:ribonuclease 3 [Iodidimonas muriae]|uniref:Ribonuclease 3 n=1 Tax=Iodidimonas muriae TaxID=261467 RepID=A0ABQ2L679_9PROT|nr:ribonuclease III [Iodidimonas muriae]GER06365.1 ribonuclease 3 [Kordiimonadales bacterium JCM 17843]GGO04488.1 ribonuclease 3 [Iodidimonas muriae]